MKFIIRLLLTGTVLSLSAGLILKATDAPAKGASPVALQFSGSSAQVKDPATHPPVNLPALKPPTFAVPPALQGVVSPEEFQKFQEFMANFSNSPANKDLMDKLSSLGAEMRKVSEEMRARRATALEANPEIKAIEAKLSNANKGSRK